jgi:hypothetical protein
MQAPACGPQEGEPNQGEGGTALEDDQAGDHGEHDEGEEDDEEEKEEEEEEDKDDDDDDDDEAEEGQGDGLEEAAASEAVVPLEGHHPKGGAPWDRETMLARVLQAHPKVKITRVYLDDRDCLKGFRVREWVTTWLDEIIGKSLPRCKEPKQTRAS